MDKTLATRWMELLAQEGYRPLLDGNEENEALSRITFKREGKTYELFLDENDPMFAHLELAFTVDDRRHERDLLVRVGNDNNQCLKAAKTTIDGQGDGARFHMEWFQEGLPTPASSTGSWRSSRRPPGTSSRRSARRRRPVRWRA